MMNKQIQETLFSSKKTDWVTPIPLFQNLNKMFGPFTLDSAATKENTKCVNFYSPEQNGLILPWSGIVFCNPPYGRNVIDKWVKKGYTEAIQNHDSIRIVMLLPARVDTKWFHDYCRKAKEIYFIKGRIQFSNHKTGAPFPSMIVVFEHDVYHLKSVDCKNFGYLSKKELMKES